MEKILKVAQQKVREGLWIDFLFLGSNRWAPLLFFLGHLRTQSLATLPLGIAGPMPCVQIDGLFQLSVVVGCWFGLALSHESTNEGPAQYNKEWNLTNILGCGSCFMSLPSCMNCYSRLKKKKQHTGAVLLILVWSFVQVDGTAGYPYYKKAISKISYLFLADLLLPQKEKRQKVSLSILWFYD